MADYLSGHHAIKTVEFGPASLVDSGIVQFRSRMVQKARVPSN